MEEDELGTMRTISPSVSPSLYIVCARCARAIPPQDVMLVAGDALNGGDEYEQVCGRCYAALIEGEQDLPLNEP